MKSVFIIGIVAVAMIGVMVPSVFAQQFEDFDYSIRGGEVLKFELDADNTSLLISIDARARGELIITCLLYTSPSPRDKRQSRMPSSA